MKKSQTTRFVGRFPFSSSSNFKYKNDSALIWAILAQKLDIENNRLSTFVRTGMDYFLRKTNQQKRQLIDAKVSNAVEK